MRVLIVDDDRLVSSSLKTILETDSEIEVVGTGNSGKEAITLYNALQPDVLLMDIRMDGMTGIEVADTLLQQNPAAKILFLTTFSDDDYIIRALQIGAKGYILKQNFESIVPSVKTVFIGQRVFGDEIITKIPSLINDGNKMDFSELGVNNKEFEIYASCKRAFQQGNFRKAVFK